MGAEVGTCPSGCSPAGSGLLWVGCVPPWKVPALIRGPCSPQDPGITPVPLLARDNAAPAGFSCTLAPTPDIPS